MFNKEDFEQFVHDNMNYEEKVRELIQDAKNANFVLIMVLTKYNSLLDKFAKEFDELGDDLFTQMMRYEALKVAVEPMMNVSKNLANELKE